MSTVKCKKCGKSIEGSNICEDCYIDMKSVDYDIERGYESLCKNA